jgi:hypothetical protein
VSSDRIVKCGQCKRVLDETGGEAVESRLPCPSCGSTTRTVELHIESHVTLRSMLSLKAKPTVGKWFQRQKVGDELFRLTGTWHRLSRLIDRRGNRYREHIVDERGEVVRDVDEPLTDHTDRGDARR